MWAGLRSVWIPAPSSWNHGECLWSTSPRLSPMGSHSRSWKRTDPNLHCRRQTQIYSTSSTWRWCTDWSSLYWFRKILLCQGQPADRPDRAGSWNPHERCWLPFAVDSVHSRWATSTWFCHWRSPCWWPTNVCGEDSACQHQGHRLLRLGHHSRILWLFLRTNININVHTGAVVTPWSVVIQMWISQSPCAT